MALVCGLAILRSRGRTHTDERDHGQDGPLVRSHGDVQCHRLARERPGGRAALRAKPVPGPRRTLSDARLGQLTALLTDPISATTVRRGAVDPRDRPAADR